MLQPLEIERNELGYSLDEVREGRYLRVVHRECTESTTCVFLVHGGGGRAGQFKHVIKSLQDKVNVVAFDFLGHGDSPSPNQPELYTADEHLRDLTVIYNKYKCERNLFVAHCYGGVHTLRLLDSLGEERIREIVGVVIIGLGDTCIPGTVFGHLPASILEVLRPLARSSSNAALFTPTSDPELVAFENGISNNNKMYIRDESSPQGYFNPELWDGYIRSGARILISADVPRVLIGGEGDGVFPPDKVIGLQRLLEVPDEACHMIKGAGHLVMLEQPGQVLDILLKLL